MAWGGTHPLSRTVQWDPPPWCCWVGDPRGAAMCPSVRLSEQNSPGCAKAGGREAADLPPSINFHARIIIGKLEIWLLDSRFVSPNEGERAESGRQLLDPAPSSSSSSSSHPAAPGPQPSSPGRPASRGREGRRNLLPPPAPLLLLAYRQNIFYFFFFSLLFCGPFRDAVFKQLPLRAGGVKKKKYRRSSSPPRPPIA